MKNYKTIFMVTILLCAIMVFSACTDKKVAITDVIADTSNIDENGDVSNTRENGSQTNVKMAFLCSV